jgi:hypothetical protein
MREAPRLAPLTGAIHWVSLRFNPFNTRESPSPRNPLIFQMARCYGEAFEFSLQQHQSISAGNTR